MQAQAAEAGAARRGRRAGAGGGDQLGRLRGEAGHQQAAGDQRANLGDYGSSRRLASGRPGPGTVVARLADKLMVIDEFSTLTLMRLRQQ